MAKKNFDDVNIDTSVNTDKLVVNLVAQEPKKQGRPPVNREKKKRVSMSLFPSDYEKIQQIAFEQRASVSDIFGDLMKKYIAENQNDLREFEKMKKE